MDPKQVRIVFMGTPEFAVESLSALVENNYNIVGVITAPDKPAGRGQKLQESAVKQYAVNRGLPVLQPEKLKNPEFLEQLNLLKPELQVVVAFRMLPEAVWNLPPLGTFNLHASLLPQYRGAAPLNWAIINGETETGVTTFLLTHEIDTGKILFQEKTSIGKDDTAGDLHDRLMVIGSGLVLRTIDTIAEGNINPLNQEDLIHGQTSLKSAPKIFRETMQIDWNKPAEQIRNLIRGLTPYPTAWTIMLNKSSGEETELKIFSATMPEVHKSAVPGTILSDGKDFFDIACADGWLRINDLQLAGKKRMKISDFLRGFAHPENYCVKKRLNPTHPEGV
jgi:methionyl-tRNA formyltransferase